MNRTESLLRGAAALAVAGLIVKMSNLLVRVPLTRLLGSEGIGIYQMALPALWALLHVAAGGVPVAVQNLVTEYTTLGRRRASDQVLRLALGYSLVAGGISAGVLALGASLLARLLGEARAYWPLMAVAPAVLLFALDSIYRNYLQGLKLMTPSAMASISEQTTKILVTVAAAYFFIALGVDKAAGGAALGITAGALVSVLYMAYVCRQVRSSLPPDRDPPESRALLIRRIFSLAWPVTLGNLSMPLLQLVDVGVVQKGFLRAGFAQSEATAMYGAFSGIAVTVVWFPFVLTNALGNALAPVLTTAAAQGDRERVYQRVLLGLRATALVCLPVAVGVAVMAGPIAAMFGEPQAAIPLLCLAPVALLGPLAWLMNTQLQSLGKTGPPMRNLALCMAVKITLDAFLAPIRGIDVRGVSAASVIMFVLWCWLNARTLEAELDAPLPWGSILRGPLGASVIMGTILFGLGVTGNLPRASWAAVCLAGALAPILYVATLLATGAVTRSELAGLAGPLGPRLERWLHTLWPWS